MHIENSWNNISKRHTECLTFIYPPLREKVGDIQTNTESKKLRNKFKFF